jgi:hypothetical protein
MTHQSIFLDLKRSEQNHMDQIKTIMDRYGVRTPVPDQGALQNQTLIHMYADLLSRGNRSDEEALRAAGAFEEISIMDLQREIAATDNQDIIAIYQGLLAGSRKHLFSLVNALEERGTAYTPQYLSRTEFDETIG